MSSLEVLHCSFACILHPCTAHKAGIHSVCTFSLFILKSFGHFVLKDVFTQFVSLLSRHPAAIKQKYR